MTLSEALDAERARQDLTVYRLAQMCDIDRIVLHKILDGRTPGPRWGNVIKILESLGKDLEWLGKQLMAKSENLN